MLKKAFKKLNSNDGVSILLALLLFLTVTMVVSVIISASSTAAKNIKYDEDQQQMYLTDSSMGTVLCDEISSGIMKLRYDEDDSEYVPIEEGDSEVPSSVYSDDLFPADNNLLGKNGSTPVCAFAPLIKKAVEDTLNGNSVNYSFALKVNGTHADKFEKVYVNFIMSSNYDIRIILSNKDENGHVIYNMTMSIPADEYNTSVDFSGGSGDAQWEDIKVLSWTGGTILRDRWE